MGNKNVHVGNVSNRNLGYTVKCFDEESSVPVESVQLESAFIRSHYILFSSGRKDPANFFNGIFDVVHESELAEAALYDETIKFVREMVRKYESKTRVLDQTIGGVFKAKNTALFR